MNLLLLSYNNYFNRQLRRTNLNGYLSHSPKMIPWQGEFNSNDGVNATVNLNFYGTSPDYLVVVDDNNKIVSRWFIADTERIRKGQYRCSLKRDLIADYYEIIIDSPSFIEKGFVPINNPLVYNKEDFNCNQIKVGENLISDKSHFSWIVLYYNLSLKTDNANGVMSGSVDTIEEEYFSIDKPTIEDWEIVRDYGGVTPYKYLSPNRRIIRIEVDVSGSTYESFCEFVTTNEQKFAILETGSSQSDTELKYFGSIKQSLDKVIYYIGTNGPSIYEKLNEYEVEDISLSQLKYWDGKIVKTNDGEFNRIKVSVSGSGSIEQYITDGELYNAVVQAFKSGELFKDSNFSGTFENAIKIKISYTSYLVSYSKVTDGVHTYSYDFKSCRDVQDQPYGIICLPYKADKNINTYFDRAITSLLDTDVSLLIAKKMCSKGVGADKPIYDVQILPYCPVDLEVGYNEPTDEYFLDPSVLDDDAYTLVFNDGSPVGAVSIAIHPISSKFTKFINYQDEDQEDIKVENQCTFYRLCSPNWSGQFEFNKARNGGIQYFNVDCTYKPYTPYIHVNPNFKNLYGDDFNDARGLICGGDFSMPIVSDAWENYKLQNKNFEDMFNRQIKNMDSNYETQRSNAIANLAMSTVKGAAGGAIAGANPATIALGAATGAISGAINMNSQEKNYKEQRDYSIDMHNYQLDNIKAMPDSLTKVDSFTNNNKIFPVLEKYTCTDEEKEIFKSKLEFEGMTVNAIGKIREYLNPVGETFIKARPLRLLGINDDSHMLYSIYEELSKGYYFAEVDE